MAFLAAPIFTGTAFATTMGTALAVGSTVLTLAGAGSQADAMEQAAATNAANAQAVANANAANANAIAQANADAMRTSAEANKKQLEYQAGQEEALSQRQAVEDRHKAMLMLSRAQAVAASSGGGALSESLMSGILNQGETQAGYSMYAGTERAKGLRYQGDIALYDALSKGNIMKTEAYNTGNIERITAGNQSAAAIADASNRASATLIGGAATAGTMFSRLAPYDPYGKESTYYIEKG